MIENLKTVLFLKKWAIHGLPFFIIVFSKQMLHKKFADDWNWTTDLWCKKRPLYQLSHNHCPKTVLLRTNFWTNFLSQDSLTCISFWENMRPHLNDKKLNWNKLVHFHISSSDDDFQFVVCFNFSKCRNGKKLKLFFGSCCGTLGRAFAPKTREPGFEIQPSAFL